MKWIMYGLGTVIVVLCLGGVLLGVQDSLNAPTPNYQTGEIVHLVINGERAQIVSAYRCLHSTGCIYSVRISGTAALTHVQEFEIRKAKP